MSWNAYFKDVLGLKHLYGLGKEAPVLHAGQTSQVWNEQGYAQLSQVTPKTKVLFIQKLGGESIFEPAAFEMTNKMAQAMKLEADQYQIFETSSTLQEIKKSLESDGGDKTVVWLEGQETGQRGNIFKIPATSEMLKNPALKKNAWEILKQAMKVRT